MNQSRLNDEDLKVAVANTPYEKVTEESIQAKITKVSYTVLPDSTVIICNITLKNGFSVRGESAIVDDRNFDEEIGRTYAYKSAFSQIWQLEGYLLSERRHQGQVTSSA